jgi:hypothetical protein
MSLPIPLDGSFKRPNDTMSLSEELCGREVDF